jgi:hypothetical protein
MGISFRLLRYLRAGGVEVIRVHSFYAIAPLNAARIPPWRDKRTDRTPPLRVFARKSQIVNRKFPR